MIETLGDFDSQVASKLFALYSEWEKFARAEDDCGENALIVSVKPPNQNVNTGLTITTIDKMVSVFFDYYHTHFDDLDEGALALIENIKSDEYLSVSYWRDDERCGDGLYHSSRLPVSNDQHPYANKIIFRSWSGSKDKELRCVGRD